ncbi:AraC-like DNA-binding protein [Silvimonas terrae]|uniref:AraC-like DNA-binding protein n=1 Tax=Silvimonas terrae TaxID=300266 RepID=A0A840RLH8_9NEIS|nr:AraC family transcriptional regulator [Silvimonas terrae]MBB5193350.1 AraC-like DNA-binding protein [Silvimonas terrae]
MPALHRALARTVSNRIAVYLQRSALQAGLSSTLFTRHTGIAPDDLLDPNGRIDGERHRRMVQLAGKLALPPVILAESNTGLFTDFPALGNVCLNSRTLREALMAFNAFRPLIGEFDFLLCKISGQHVRFDYLAEFAPESGFQALANFQVLASLTRLYDQHQPTRFAVELMGHAPPAVLLRQINDFFGAAVRFGCAANRMSFTAPALDTVFSQHNAMLAPMLQQHAQQALVQVRQLHSFAGGVESLIREFINDPQTEIRGAALLQQLCDRLQTSRWSLHRQLQLEGTHFRELETKVKISESRRLLGNPHITLAQISEQLGFASQSAFTRFFRARHEMAPLAFRQHALLRAGKAA